MNQPTGKIVSENSVLNKNFKKYTTPTRKKKIKTITKNSPIKKSFTL